MARFFSKTILLLAFCFLGASAAVACICLPGRGAGDKNYQPCTAFRSAEAIFIGRAESIVTENGEMRVGFSIEKAIRGVENLPSVEVRTTANPGRCGYPFQEGERYFVYARRRADGKLTDGLCSPTVLLADAESDLAYLREIEAGKSGTRLFGYVSESRWESSKTARTRVPLSGIEITIKGRKNKFRTRTDESGFYLFRDIPSDTYHVKADLPDALREFVHTGDLEDRYAIVNAEYSRCAEASFTASSLSSIRLNVFDRDGRQPPQKYLWLLPLDENDKAVLDSPVAYIWTHIAGGEAFFNLVPPGRYKLAVNRYDCHENYAPQYGRSFYPGVADESKAGIIEVGRNQQLKPGDFRLLPPLKERWISGTVLSADKLPVADAFVFLRNADQTNPNECFNRVGETKTDRAGRFSMRGYEGYRYQIRASGEVKNPGATERLSSKSVDIPLKGEAQNIELIVDSAN